MSVTVTFPSGKTQTVSAPVPLSPLPRAAIGNDTLLCVGQTLLLRASYPGANYSWQDGSSADTFLVSQPGAYRVQVGIGNCWVSDSLQVHYTSPPKVNLGADWVSCDGQPRLLKSTFSGAHYRWSDGSTDSTLLVDQSSLYWVELTNACGVARDTIEVTFESLPEVDLGSDTTLCVGDTLLLDAYSPYARSYFWSDGSDESHLQVTGPGTYWVTVRSQSCLVSDRIQVQVQECPQRIFIPNVFTPNRDGQNEIFQVKGIQLGRWQLEVYNRLGQQVYFSSAYRNDWNAEGLESTIYY